MAKETFLNLPKHKQDLILDVAIKEFYEKGYDLTSISSIVEKSGIAKGSFYQYFDGKDGLFRYIIVITNDKKMEFAQPVIVAFDQLNFFDWFQNMLVATFEFLRSYPVLAKISVDFWKHANAHVKKRILGEEMSRTNQFLAYYIEKAQKKQELRDDIPIDYLTHFISNQLAFFTDYLLDTYEDLTKISVKDLEGVLKNFMGTLKTGTMQVK